MDGQDGDTSKDSDSSSSPSDSDSDEPATNNAPENGGGAGKNPESVKKAQQALADALKEAVDNLTEDIRSDASAINGADFGLEGGHAVSLDKAKPVEYSVSPEAVLASNAFGRELEELRVAHEAGWNRRTKSGKLNIGRIIKGCEFDEAFDKFQVGRADAVDIEAVVLLDTSGSMNSMARSAFESMWAIKRGLDAVHASTTVVTFDDDAERLYDADEPAGKTMRYAFSGGGTTPLKAMRYARNVLAQSDRKVKVLFTITDGSWGNDDKEVDIVNILREGGVVTALVTLGGYSYGNHAHELSAVANQPSALLGLARQLVGVATERNLAS